MAIFNRGDSASNHLIFVCVRRAVRAGPFGVPLPSLCRHLYKHKAEAGDEYEGGQA
jgi:hypothetical protein